MQQGATAAAATPHNKDNMLPEACDREMRDELQGAGGRLLLLNFEINTGAVRYQKRGEI